MAFQDLQETEFFGSSEMLPAKTEEAKDHLVSAEMTARTSGHHNYKAEDVQQR